MFSFASQSSVWVPQTDETSTKEHTPARHHQARAVPAGDEGHSVRCEVCLARAFNHMRNDRWLASGAMARRCASRAFDLRRTSPIIERPSRGGIHASGQPPVSSRRHRGHHHFKAQRWAVCFASNLEVDRVPRYPAGESSDGLPVKWRAAGERRISSSVWSRSPWTSRAASSRIPTRPRISLWRPARSKHRRPSAPARHSRHPARAALASALRDGWTVVREQFLTKWPSFAPWVRGEGCLRPT